MTLPSLLVLYCTREKRVRGGSGSHAGRKLNHRIHTKIKFSLKLLRQTQKPSVCKTGSAKLRPEEMVIVAAHVENLHGDGRKNERVCVYFTITAAHDISSCSCKELKSQSVISGWLNYHPSHCNPYKSPSGARMKISTTKEEQRIQTAAGSSTARNVCYQTPSQSSAVSIPHFLEQKQFSNLFQAVLKATKGFKPKVSFTAGCPQ